MYDNNKPPAIPKTYEVRFQEEVADKCKIVVFLALDGLGCSVENNSETPNFQKFFASGASSFKVKAIIPTDSAQNWGSILHGVGRDKLELDNGDVESPIFCFPEDSNYPSIPKLLINRDENIKITSYVGWENERFNIGLMEPSALEKIDRYSPLTHEDEQLVKKLKKDHNEGNSDYDSYVTSKAISCIQNYSKKDAALLMIIHLTDADEHGHHHEFGSTKYLEQIKKMDSQIEDILKAIDKRGWRDSSLVIMVTDHGGIGKSHGGEDPKEVNVFMAVRGPGIKPGSEIKSERENGELFNMDCATIILKVLGVNIPDNFDAKLPFIPLIKLEENA